MKIQLLNQEKIQIRNKEIRYHQVFKRDNDLKVKYSEEILDVYGSDFDVFPHQRKAIE